MTYEEFKNKLTAAGNEFDGHATIGSIEEQMKVIKSYMHDAWEARYKELQELLAQSK